MKRAALISVSDRSGLGEFAAGLHNLGFKILATSGSAKFLAETNIPCMGIDEYTGQPEILDGRVKTLHPKIHAGLLARMDKTEHVNQLAANDILPIQVAAINLYPFIEKVRGETGKDIEKMIEFIDIGGPTMIRAAAKNHSSVLPVIDPKDYPSVIEFLNSGEAGGKKELEFRRYLASRVFTAIAEYDLEIARFMAKAANSSLADTFGPIEGTVLAKEQELRYGENPQQKATYYRPAGSGEKKWEQLNGKELSYNNLLDIDAALRMITVHPSKTPTAIIIKHANPCGAAHGSDLFDAVKKAKLCDPRSHFGGILAFNGTVTKDVAESIREDFAEVVIAPDYIAEALTVLRSSKALRVLRVDEQSLRDFEMRSVIDGILIQERDKKPSDVTQLEVVTNKKPTSKEMDELQFAWLICTNVKSNAIVLVKDGLLIGVGAGQMSRIDSVELALSKAKTHKHDVKGAVAASDAFFPFTDNVETLANAGVSAIVVPSGAKRDAEVIECANKLGISIVFAPDRHFRH